MKILHIINNLDAGGAQKLLEESIPLMNNIEGISVNILILSEKNAVFSSKIKKNKIQIMSSPFKDIKNPLNVFYIRKILKEGNYDIVHVHLFPANYWTAIARKLIFKNKPQLITTEHNTHNRRRDKKFFKYLDRQIYSEYNKIVSISEQTHENLVEWLGLNYTHEKRFSIIKNGVNLDNFKNAVPYKKNEIISNFKENDKLLCMVGRFAKQKDQETLIRAIQKLPDNIHLILVGEGEQKNDMERLTMDLKIKKNVHFLGFRDDVDRIFKTVDIVMISSHWEGFGLVAVEGMAAAKPVIASNVPGLSDVVEGAGILFESGNIDSLVKDINSLFDNQMNYDRVKELCVRRAELYSIKKMTNSYVVEYDSLMKNSNKI